MHLVQEVTFVLHNQKHTIKTDEISPETTLIQYLRDHEHLKGTKYMCLEGGCGACIVAVTTQDPLNKKTITFSVNSCLVSIYSCQGWTMHTVEGIGNKKIGYHPIQKTLATFNGTQCGFCSPGMVMSLYPLYESNNMTMKDVEVSFGGNLCRCTGYRPILTAFKSLAKDASPDVLGEYPDIEDLEKCSNQEENCQRMCRFFCKPSRFASTQSQWYKVYSINEIFDVFDQNPGKTYILVAGNTARGVYRPQKQPDIYIDITSVTNLINDNITNEFLTLGANKTLRNTIRLFRKIAKSRPNFTYLNKLADHLELVAHVAVRNIGTLAGNLSIKHRHHEFPSDIFLILETVGSKLNIVNSDRTERQYTLKEYLSLDMTRKVIKNVILPGLNDSYQFGSYKITPRAQNAHAMVNAGFLLQLDTSQKVQTARIVYGGINPSFVRAKNAEQYLVGKHLFDNTVMQAVFAALEIDVQPDSVLPQPSPEFRKHLAISLFYKYILSIAKDQQISPENKSGGAILTRPISNGTQDYQSNKSLYPLTQPIPKLEALYQTAGELEYITDMPEQPGELYAYFVVAKAAANSIVTKIDPSEALKMKGVVAFYDKKDIPGTNSFFPMNANYTPGFIPPGVHLVPEELFCSGNIQYYNQPLGVIVAKTQELAEKAADLVKVTYSASSKKPLLNIREVLKAKATDKIFNEANLEATAKGNDIKHVVKGSFDTSWQYHFHMETQTCIVVPKDGGLEVFPSTQWMDIIQVAIADVLKIPENKINISVRRLGGAFGAKISRNCLLACATALAAYKLQRPVRMRMSFSTNMDVIGKRYPASADYEVGLDENAKIQYLNATFFLDYAAGGNEPIVNFAISAFYVSYVHDTWNVIGNFTKTDNHSGIFMRAPGNTTIFAMSETIMEHIAMVLNKPSTEVRLTNMDKVEHKKLIQFIDETRRWAEYDDRKEKIEQFNRANRWRKKGITLLPMTFPFENYSNISALVAIYAGDGSVSVSHGGIEIGQGINTKVAQVCAYALGIPLDLVSVKSTNNMISPNNIFTGSSFTSESACYSTMKACETLLARMKPVKDKMHNPTWQQWVKQCQNEYVELVATHMYSPNEKVDNYNIYGVCVTEVEVDILTGMYQILRVDLLEDAGDTVSPFIDIGQVEGAFVMGQGFWTSEEMVFDYEGKLLTNRTWNYKIPGALDIPIDFRVKFPKNNPNQAGILHSKSTGEPPLCLGFSVPIAIRQAVASARTSANPKVSKWYPIEGPSTVENTFLNCLNDFKQYIL